MPPSNLPKVMVLQLAERSNLQSDGTTSDRTVPCVTSDAKALEGLGPYFNSIRVLTLTENKTANFRWYVVVQGSLDNKTWSSATALHAYVTANGQVPQTDYTNLDNLAWPFLRFGLACSNVTGAARESADVTAWLIVTMKS